MQLGSLGSSMARWQARMRLVSLLVLIAVSAVTATAVVAQADSVSSAPISAPAASAATQEIASTLAGEQRFGVREMFAQADWVVKSVMIVLVFCSLLTWAVLFEKLIVFARARRANNRFLEAFRKGELEQLDAAASNSAMARMWQVSQAELKQFSRNRSQEASADQINRLLQRMSLTSSIVQERDLARLGSMMGVLATIGATAPFIGLFGTVWGILNSFASIATMKSSSLAIVAPGIAEALLATALGLFAAIPAVMIFNKFARDINGFVGALDNFSAEMIAAMSRKMDEVR